MWQTSEGEGKGKKLAREGRERREHEDRFPPPSPQYSRAPFDPFPFLRPATQAIIPVETLLVNMPKVHAKMNRTSLQTRSPPS